MREDHRYMNKVKTGIIGNRSGVNTFGRPLVQDGQI